MAIELKQSLKLSQQLVITPQLQQAIKLLQLSRLELVEMVQNELLENPILEDAPAEEEEEVPAEIAKEIETEEAPDKSHEAQAEVKPEEGEFKDSKEFDWENYISSYNAPGQEFRASYNSDEMPTFDNVVSAPKTLQEHLEWQLHLTPMADKEEEVGLTLIGILDDNGYLTTPLEEIAEKNNYTLQEVTDALEIIQELDPPGVGACDLKECLMLQARFFGKERPLLEAIINTHLHYLEKKDFDTIARKLKVPVEQIIEAARIIADMEPKPGRPFGGSAPQYITPDVFVYKVANEYVVVLNEEGLPRLHVSNFYRNMLTSNGKGHGETVGGDKAKGYIQDKLKKALWLIKSIHQRQRTLYRVSKCIVEYQQEFFDKGVNFLKPMILKDVAEKIGVHESTVSRATSNKYMHTPQGLFELKFFFSSRVSTNNGEGIASESVKEKIKRLIANEDSKKPLSDQELAALLKSANINVARRTVAKYREMLRILPSSRRKQLY